MRIVGIDFGERRIGVAAAEERTRLAIPVTTLDVQGDPVDTIIQLVENQRADELVIGLPLLLSGAEGQQAQRVREIVAALSARLPIRVETWDERLTTAEASRRPPLAQRRAKGRRIVEGSRDAIAAAILLQAYLDSRSPA